MRKILRGHSDGKDYAESLALWGVDVKASELAEPPYDLWPENERPVEVFRMLGTQWNVGGMGGAVGLRYESLPFVLQMLGVEPAEHRDIFDGLRLMEGEALRVWREERNGG